MRSIRSPMKRAKPNTAWTGWPSRSTMGNAEWYARNIYTDASIRKINVGVSRQPTLDAVVQGTRTGEVSEQVLHLVREHTPPLEENIFRIGGREWHGNELHLRLLGRSRGLLIVTPAAGRYDIGPDVDATLAEWPDVIPRQLARREAHSAIHAQKRIAAEQRLIVQRWNIVVPGVARITCVSDGGDNRVDLEHRPQSAGSVDTAIELVEG